MSKQKQIKALTAIAVAQGEGSLEAAMRLADITDDRVFWLKFATELTRDWTTLKVIAKKFTKMSEIAEAVAIYNELIRQGCDEVWCEIGSIHEESIDMKVKRADFAKAEECYKRALQRESHHIDALAGLARVIMLRRGPGFEAAHYIRRGLKLNPKHEAIISAMRQLLRYDPDSLIPWNAFEPRSCIFALYPECKRKEIFAWLCVSRRLKLPKDIRLLMVKHLTSRNEAEWSYKCMYCHRRVDEAYDNCGKQQCPSMQRVCEVGFDAHGRRLCHRTPLKDQKFCIRDLREDAPRQYKLHLNDPQFICP